MTLQIKPSPISETKDHRWKLGCQYPRPTITCVPAAPFFFSVAARSSEIWCRHGVILEVFRGFLHTSNVKVSEVVRNPIKHDRK